MPGWVLLLSVPRIYKEFLQIIKGKIKNPIEKNGQDTWGSISGGKSDRRAANWMRMHLT